MSKKIKKKILFVSIYHEVLKTFVPLMKSLQNDYDIYVLAKHYPFGDDKRLSEKLINDFSYEGIESLDLGDQTSWRRGKGLTSRWYRVYDSFIKTVYIHIKANSQAKDIIGRIQPDLVIVGSDSRTLERYIIEHCEKKDIPSICFQWALSAISKNSIREGKTRTLSIETRTIYEQIMDKLYNAVSYLVGRFNGLIVRILMLRIKLRIIPSEKIRVFGQGNATKLALIGESSKKFQEEMGTPIEKIEVVGHPLYENIYNNITLGISNKVNKEEVFKKLNIPINSNFILWANNDSKKQYAKYYSDEFMFKSWEEKILAILDANKEIYIIFKIHPVWNSLKDFQRLESISPRIRVLSGMDIEDLLPFSSALVVRHSMAAIFGMLYQVPLISFNYPPLPVGGLFGEIGGTIHVNNNSELKKVMFELLSRDKNMKRLIQEKKEFFLNNHLSINCSKEASSNNLSIERFNNLVSSLLNK
ncbi:hypothetical protein HOK00_09735 [bacterium]|jgi:hypothetical protein|nr:hypothetical protein [bacterium]